MRPRGFWHDANALCYGDGEDVLAAGARLSLADAASLQTDFRDDGRRELQAHHTLRATVTRSPRGRTLLNRQ